MPNPPFPKLVAAREAFKALAADMPDIYQRAIKDAMAAGEYEVAIKAMQWFMEHSPTHEGIALLDTGVDVAKSDKGSKGPQIQIGIKLGGHQENIGGAGNPGSNRTLPAAVNQPEALPTELQIIEVEPENE